MRRASRKAGAPVYTRFMAQGGSKAWIWIVVGLVGLVGLCCIGAAGVGFFAYTEQAKREERAFEDLMRYEDEMRRAEEEAQRAYEQAQREAVGVGVAAPPSLGLAPGRTSDRATRGILASVTRADGSSGVRVGDICAFDVVVRDQPGFPGHLCRAFVECAGIRLYGADTPSPNGFFPCELYQSPLGVAGEDLDSTVNGGDGIFQIDTRSGRLVVIDDPASMVGSPFHIEATITSVR